MKITPFLLASILVMLPQQVFAQDAVSAPPPSVSPAMQGSLPPQKEMMMTGMQQFKPTMQAMHGNMQQMMQDNKAAFQQKLQAFKDDHKKAVAQDLQTKLNDINKNRTDMMTSNLTKLNDIITKLGAERDTLQTQGKDVSTITIAITAAEQAMTTAQTAVTTQAGKDYTPQITDETTVKQNFSQELFQLHTDLTTTQLTVANAKQAVIAIITAIKQVKGDTTTVSVTPSISPVPSASDSSSTAQ